MATTLPGGDAVQHCVLRSALNFAARELGETPEWVLDQMRRRTGATLRVIEDADMHADGVVVCGLAYDVRMDCILLDQCRDCGCRVYHSGRYREDTTYLCPACAGRLDSRLGALCEKTRTGSILPLAIIG